MLFELDFNFVRNRLVLPGIRAATNDQGLSECGHVAQIQYANFLCLFGFGGVDGGEAKPGDHGFVLYCLLYS